MKTILNFMVLALLAAMGTAEAAYKETMDPNGSMGNLQSFGIVNDGAKSDQSEVLQQAIDKVAKRGGGTLWLPKGTYSFTGVMFRSNIHLLIEAGTIITPPGPGNIFMFDAERPGKKGLTEKQERAFIENVSIRGGGGRFTVDYSDQHRTHSSGPRAVFAKMVKNFLIENMDIKDNYTTYCGITLAPLQTNADVRDWEVSRATDGLIRNCSISNAHPGYGFSQLHGARRVHYENVYGTGGVTLRLETGAKGPQTAVFDVSANNVTNENGRCAVMFGPHSNHNGLVNVTNVVAISSTFAVKMGKGSIKESERERDPNVGHGSFAPGTSVTNVRVVYGKKAQIKKANMLMVPESNYDDLILRWKNKFFEGPSVGAVMDKTEGSFKINVENITMEGFPKGTKSVMTEKDFRLGNWGKEFAEWTDKYGETHTKPIK